MEWIDLAHIMGQWPALVNEVFGSINRREFFEWRKNCQLCKKVSAAWSQLRFQNQTLHTCPT